MDEVEIYRRRMVRTFLFFFSSAQNAREVQARGAFGPTELMEQWSKVYPQNEDFWTVFAEPERTAIRELSTAIEQLRNQAGSSSLHIEHVIRLPAWNSVETRAQH